MRFKRSFSLLETLIATGILVVVVLGVVALSNSLIAGTITNADKTIVNRWAVEGLELVQKVRDDNISSKNADTGSGLPIWFSPAIKDNGDDYGWYVITERAPNQSLNFTKLSTNRLITTQIFKESGVELKSDATVAYRLICVEGYSALEINDTNTGQFSCNSNQSHGLVRDGSRLSPSTTDCNPSDGYCLITKDFIDGKIIPVGNAVKVRSVIVWEDRNGAKVSSISTLLTNWRSYEN